MSNLGTPVTYALDARTATDHFPGIGRYVHNLAHALAGQLAPHERLALLRDPGVSSRWQLPAAHKQVQLVDALASPFSLRQQWSIPRLLRRIDAHLYHSPYYLMPYRVSSPVVLTVYDLIPQHFPELVSPRARLLFRLATRFALLSADQITAISVWTRTDLLAYYDVDPQSVRAIPLAPDRRFRRQSETEVARVLRRYELVNPYYLYLGINKPHKNLLRLVEAWELLVRQVPNPPLLVIAGAWDPRYPEVRELVAARGLSQAVRFLGPVAESDLPGLYTGADCFVFPSLYEGFGLPVIEAMACGTAVACANASSLPEVGGDAALYFDPLVIEDIAGVLVELCEDEAMRTEIARRGVAQAQRFSWDQTAAAMLRLYREVAQGS